MQITVFEECVPTYGGLMNIYKVVNALVLFFTWYQSKSSNILSENMLYKIDIIILWKRSFEAIYDRSIV